MATGEFLHDQQVINQLFKILLYKEIYLAKTCQLLLEDVNIASMIPPLESTIRNGG
jgi:hypothetical protein